MNIYPIVKELSIPLGSLALGSLIGKYLGKKVHSFALKDVQLEKIQNSVAPIFEAVSTVTIPAFLLVSNRVLPGNVIGTASQTNKVIINIAFGAFFAFSKAFAGLSTP